MSDKPFHTCPTCGGDGAQMLTLDARRGWQEKEPFFCEHEDCYKKGHKAIYEIACRCGDEFFLCERHGEWEIMKAKKGWRGPKGKAKDFCMLVHPSEGSDLTRDGMVDDRNSSGIKEIRLKDLGVKE